MDKKKKQIVALFDKIMQYRLRWIEHIGARKGKLIRSKSVEIIADDRNIKNC